VLDFTVITEGELKEEGGLSQRNRGGEAEREIEL
jgi:hypothetical protein